MDRPEDLRYLRHKALKTLRIPKEEESAMSTSKGSTGTPDITYNLISIAFHALQGAETYDQYIQDAQQAGDQELAQFFQQVKQENAQRANRAKELLAKQLAQGQI
jgi:hypothetical protein